MWHRIILYQTEGRHKFLTFVLEVAISNLSHDADYADRNAYWFVNKTSVFKTKKKPKIRGFGPRTNYTDRATAGEISANFSG
jgi:hypothetical protein